MYDELSESLTGKSSPAEPTGDAANGAASPIAPAEFVQLIRVVEQPVVRRPVHAFRLYAAPLPSGRGAVALGLRKKLCRLKGRNSCHYSRASVIVE